MKLKNYVLYNSQRYASQWLVLAIDLTIVVVSFMMAYLVRFNLTLNFDTTSFLKQLPIVFLITLVSFLIAKSHKGVIRHTGFRDIINVFVAIGIYFSITVSFVLLNRETDMVAGFTIPLSIIIIHSLLSFVAMSSSRVLFKMTYKYLSCRAQYGKNIVIYGSGDAGIITFNALISNPSEKVNIIGFIDDDETKAGKSINGVPIFERRKLNPEFVENNKISEVIVSIQKLPVKEFRVLVNDLIDLSLEVKVVPPFENWINGELNPNQIKQVQIEDLLDRDPIDIKNPVIENELDGEVVLVTGAAGSIGSELSRQIANYNYKQLIMIDQAESALYDLQQELVQLKVENIIPIVADIRDKTRMDYIFNKYRPTMIFHAAAYKHVPLMESNPYEAIKINMGGTKTIADAASYYKAKKFVFVSTDKAVNPTNVMGATKRAAEMYISCMQYESNTKFIITRFGNVLGSNGSVIPLFKKQIEKGGPLTVTHKEVTRYFMTIPEASQLVLEAGAMGKGGEIFIFDMGESVKIYDLALNMIRLSGLHYPTDIDIDITGLRPGEKLYEELLANGENTLPTYHDKIKISKTRPVDHRRIKPIIEEICIANFFQNNNIVLKMKELIPEYISNNSQFEKYDKKQEKLTDNRKKVLTSNFFERVND
ncbi:NDP-sugar epimerase, includes UDP-GlcNAc-inverting 4,6-dehydratase FlaA1 and capsular polysaccharide biosynthesis protein EpsC [Zhouia amylolytica]|uniref:NDP-sugar epimerase, includes UDP-GlcNAc-inverting 4,6-dehydratase FlaA1 and capsular polysaccharide biosynthesis protein EpsC n=1 Tax=Zhouia amylolytica TaxID=376730 RepID=A0A1I6VKX0_9FLAO|nr:nucleoside-diphosphate sugar epimerase/dehydratase [Zhouia amylolytica]MCQ0112273.1 polysaccharide biosynthesis protein [Zhouia amylolytica]SFT14271.1 NDP-sugar epimerase, includes UDP-GlcNAc-inverting 4,6-dehydratase FlaA1 and capsular polysaccharide biosynthesis protein EpsC [Zhouia amylolytica]